MSLDTKIKYAIISILVIVNSIIFYIVFLLESVFKYDITPYLFTLSSVLYAALSFRYLKYEKIGMFDAIKWFGLGLNLIGISFAIILPSLMAIFLFLVNLVRITELDAYLTIFSLGIMCILHVSFVWKTFKI